MLTSLRDSIKGSRVLGIAIVLLIGAGFASFGLSSYFSASAGDAVASVSGTEISGNALRMEYERQRQRIRQMFGQVPAAFDGLPLLQQSVQSLISVEIANQLVAELKLDVSDSDLAKQIQSDDNFKVEGVFDAEHYDAVVTASYPSLEIYERGLRADLARFELNKLLTSGAFSLDSEKQRVDALMSEVRQIKWTKKQASAIQSKLPTDAEISAYYEKNKTQFKQPKAVKIKYIELNRRDLIGDMLPTEVEIKAHYEKTKSKFQTDERRDVSHLLFEIDASDAATVAARRSELEAIKARIEAGEKFADLAIVHSEDVATKDNGGNLGEYAAGFLPETIDNVAFELPLTTVSDVVQSEHGLHLIYINSIEASAGKSFDEVRDQVTQEFLEEKSTLAFNEKLLSLVELIPDNEKSIEDLAQESGDELEVSAFFSIDKGEDIGGINTVREAAFAERVVDNGFVSDVVEIEVNSHAIVLQVEQVRQASQRALDEVRDDVVAALQAQYQRDALVLQRDESLQALRSGELDFASLSEQGWSEVVAEDIDRADQAAPRSVVEASFESALPATGVTASYSSSGSEVEAYLVQILGVAEVAAAEAEETADDATELPNELSVLMNFARVEAEVNVNDEAVLKVIQ